MKVVILRNKLKHAYYQHLTKTIIENLKTLPLKPDYLSYIGLILGILAGISFYFYIPLGGVFLLMSGFMDTLDGALARETNSGTKFGAFLDSILDRFCEFFALAGLFLHFYFKKPIICFFIFITLFGSLMVSYARAKAGEINISCKTGIFQRPERIIILSLGAILTIFSKRLELPIIIAIIILCFGNLYTIWERIRFVFKYTKEKQ